MHSSAAVLENDVGNNDPVEQKALELIRRFNDPDREHVLRGVFKDTDGLAEIRAKQRRAEIEISRVFSELVILRGAVDDLHCRVAFSCQRRENHLPRIRAVVLA